MINLCRKVKCFHNLNMHTIELGLLYWNNRGLFRFKRSVNTSWFIWVCSISINKRVHFVLFQKSSITKTEKSKTECGLTTNCYPRRYTHKPPNQKGSSATRTLYSPPFQECAQGRERVCLKKVIQKNHNKLLKQYSSQAIPYRSNLST